MFSSIKSGSYVIDIINPNYVYDPVRVEINNKGKIRARKVNVSWAIAVINSWILWHSVNFAERPAIADNSNSISTQVESHHHIQILSTAWTVESHWFPFLANGHHDGATAHSSRPPAKDHEWSGDEEGNGEFAAAKTRRRYAWRQWDAIKVPRRWNDTAKAEYVGKSS